MNFHLPLVQIGGRGSAGYVSRLTIEKQWDVKSQIITQTCLPTTPPIGCSTTKGYWVSDTEWKGVAVGESAGTLIGRQTGIHSYATCGSMPSLWTETITRLTFTAPDGAEYELRDKLNNGSALTAGAYTCNSGAGPDRGRVWTTVDGTTATFIADTSTQDTNGFASGNNNQQTLYLYPSGYMLMRDGTRFRIDNGVVSWVRDSNGNKVTSTQDSLNRTYTKTVTTNSSNETTLYTFKGAGGAARNITVVKDWTINALRTDYRPGGSHYITGGDASNGGGYKTFAWLFPDVYAYVGSSGGSGSPYMPGPTSIILPDNRQYKFYYNPYMELARVELPTGGAIEYDWDGFGPAQSNGFKNSVVGSGSGPAGIYRRVVERRVYADGTTMTEKTKYQETQVNGNAVITVDQLTPADTLLSRSKHYFYSYALLSITSQNPYQAISYEDAINGREYQTETYDSDGVTLLRKEETTWQPRASYVNQYGSPGSLDVDLRVTATKSTLVDSNQVSQKTITYSADEYNNQSDVYEYDYGGTTPVRRTHTDYLTSGYDTIVGGSRILIQSLLSISVVSQPKILSMMPVIIKRR